MGKKEKILYSCPCGMLFGNRKDNYLRHMNKKKPCSKLLQNCSDTAPKLLQNAPTIIQDAPMIIQDLEIEHKMKKTEQESVKLEDKNIFCPYCSKKFCKNYNLNRHLDGRCKNKLEMNKTNTKIEQENNKLNEIDIKLDKILKQNEELKNENYKLKKQIKKTNKITNNIIVVNYHDHKLSEIDKKLFIQPLLNNIGKQKILKIIENIYVNDNCPEYHNIVITDKNRGYLKIYENGEWKTYEINLINTLIDDVLNQSKTYILELKQKYIIDNIEKIYINDTHPKYNKFNKQTGIFSKFINTNVKKKPIGIYSNGKWKSDDKDLITMVINEILTQTTNYTIVFKQPYNKNSEERLKTSEKYINYCDTEFLNELKEQQDNEEMDNVDLIKRCINFRNMIFKDTVNLLHDNKNKILKTKINDKKNIEI